MRKQSLFHIFIILLATSLIIAGTTAVFHSTQGYIKLKYLGIKQYTSNNYNVARIHLEKAISLVPTDKETARYLINIYRELDMPEQMIDELRRLHKINPSDTSIMEELADAFYSVKNYSESESLYKQILSGHESPSVKFKLAQVLVWQKKYDEGLREIETLRSDDPENMEITELYAKTLVWNKNYDKALPVLKKIYAIQDNKQETARYLVNIYRERDMQEQMLDTLNLLYQLNPQDTVLMEELADSLYSYSMYPEAEKIYRKILSIKESVSVRQKLAEILAWQKKYDNAISEIEALLRIQPDNPAINLLYIKVLVWSKHYDKAIPLLEDYNKNSTDTSETTKTLAYVYAWNKMYDNAIPIFEKLIVQYPDDLEMKEFLADIYSWTKSYDKSVALYKSLLESGVTNKETVLKLAETLRLAEKYSEAVEVYDQYFKNDQ